MGVMTMHAKSDSDATSLSAAMASLPRPLYFVQSPSHHDKMSYGNSSPFASPPPHYMTYLSSPVHHSRESSTSRFSARAGGAWRRLYARDEKVGMMGLEEQEDIGDVDEEDEEEDLRRFYIGCFLVCFVALFTVFSLILWAVATTFPPKVLVQEMVFHYFNVQEATDQTGVPTDMMNLNSTVMIKYHNPATFFGVHVSSTPFELHYYQLKIASGHMKKFYQSRKSQRRIVTSIFAKQLPLYGSIPNVSGQKQHLDRVQIPLNLTFVMRSRAYVLGRLVKPTFYQKVRCEVTFRMKQLGKPVKRFANACTYYE